MGCIQTSDSRRSIVITGSNRGIGYGLVKALCQREDISLIIMACRNQEQAIKAKNKLNQQYKQVKGKLIVTILDISKEESIDKFITWMKEQNIQIDCFVNNAGIAIKEPGVTEKMCRDTFQVNYFGTASLSEKILPFVKDNGKIINMTSNSGRLDKMNKCLADKYLDESMDKEELDKISEQLFLAIRNKNLEEKGFPSSELKTLSGDSWLCYGMSKVHANVFTRIFSQREDVLQRGIQVYACNPGWVRTKLGSPKAPRSVEEGIVTPMYLINLPYKHDEELQGKFFHDEKINPLVGGNKRYDL